MKRDGAKGDNGGRDRGDLPLQQELRFGRRTFENVKLMRFMLFGLGRVKAGARQSGSTQHINNERRSQLCPAPPRAPSRPSSPTSCSFPSENLFAFGPACPRAWLAVGSSASPRRSRSSSRSPVSPLRSSLMRMMLSLTRETRRRSSSNSACRVWPRPSPSRPPSPNWPPPFLLALRSLFHPDFISYIQ